MSANSGVSDRLWGKYRAEVLDIDDPDKRGRIKVKCESLMPDKPELGWAESCFMPGEFNLPRKGDFVWLEFEQGDISLPVWVGIMPTRKYVKEYLFKEYGDRTNYDPKIHIFRTPSHKGIHFLDGAKNGEIQITFTESTGHVIDMNGKDKYMDVKDQAGSKINYASSVGDINIQSVRYINEN